MMFSAVLPVIYTNSNDPRVANEFNKLLSSTRIDIGSLEPSEYAQYPLKISYVPYVNIGRGFDLDAFAFFNLLFYEPFQTAASWSGNQATLVTNADPNDAQNRVVGIKTKEVASFFKDIDWPEGVFEVTFDYLFPQPNGDGDLTVHVYDSVTRQPEGESQIVYYDSSTISLAKNKWETATFGIGKGVAKLNFGGKKARLNFVLRSEDGEEVSVLVDNIIFWGSSGSIIN